MTRDLLLAMFQRWRNVLVLKRRVIQIMTRRSNMSLGRALFRWREFAYFSQQDAVYQRAMVYSYQVGVRDRASGGRGAPPDLGLLSDDD